MYHLFNDSDKHKALSEAIRVAKIGGIIYSAYCNNDTCVYKLFYNKKIMRYIKDERIDENFHTVSSPDEIFELYRKSDINKTAFCRCRYAVIFIFKQIKFAE